MENVIHALMPSPALRRQILQVALVSLAVTGVILALLWHFVGVTHIDSVERQFHCWRCLPVIAMDGQRNAVAGGQSQQILHETDGLWRWERNPAADLYYATLFAAAVASRDDAWAVGETVVRYQQGIWVEQKTFGEHAGNSFFAVAAASATDVWVAGHHVGDSLSGDQGRVWHFDGHSWTLVRIFPALVFLSISAPSPDEFWLGAEQSNHGQTANGVIEHYHGGMWTQELTTPGDVNAVRMVSPSDGWTLADDGSGGTLFFHYSGGAWTQTTDLHDIRLFWLSMLSADEGWASGWASGWAGPNESAVFHFAKGQWTRIALPSHTLVYGVAALAPDDLLALGSVDIPNVKGWQRGVLLHYHNGVWTTTLIPKKHPLDFGDAISQYMPPGLAIFFLIPLLWALVQTLRAPRGSGWRHWTVRLIIAGGFLTIAGTLLQSTVTLTADNLPINPDTLTNPGNTLSLIGLVILIPSLYAWWFVKLMEISRQRRAAPTDEDNLEQA